MTKAERKRLQAEERKAQASFELKQEVYGDVAAIALSGWCKTCERMHKYGECKGA